MALKPRVRYPAQTETAVAYPYGKARNAATFQDGTGTPLEKDWLNDLFGSQQALLVAAGIIPTGAPDTAATSQYLDALKALFLGAHGGTYAIAAPGGLVLNGPGTVTLAGPNTTIAAVASIVVPLGGEISIAGGPGISVKGGARIELLDGADLTCKAGSAIGVEADALFDVVGAISVKNNGRIELIEGAALDLYGGAAMSVLGAVNVAPGGVINVLDGPGISVKDNGRIELIEGAALDLYAGSAMSVLGAVTFSGGSSLMLPKIDDLTLAPEVIGFRLAMTPAFITDWPGLGGPDWCASAGGSNTTGARWVQRRFSPVRQIWFHIPVRPGDTLTSANVRLEGGFGSAHSAKPDEMPLMEVVEQSTAGVSTVLDTQLDTSGSVATYNAGHLLQCTGGALPYLATDNPIYVRVTGEGGANSVADALAINFITGTVIVRGIRASDEVY